MKKHKPPAYDRDAFRIFAHLRPHEAARLNWPWFIDVCRQKNPGLTRTQIRKLLSSTRKETRP